MARSGVDAPVGDGIAFANGSVDDPQRLRITRTGEDERVIVLPYSDGDKTNCAVRMRLMGNHLLAVDSDLCSGVSFSGVYVRVKPGTRDWSVSCCC